METLVHENNGLTYRREHLTIRVEPYGTDAIRVRQTLLAALPEREFALLSATPGAAEISVKDNVGTLTSGSLRVELSGRGTLAFSRLSAGTTTALLSERGRRFTATTGDLSRITLDFEPHGDERFYGLGQHAHGSLDQKGCVVELRQINTQVAIPVLISSRGYGFLWHDPSVGQVELAKNRTRWVAEASRGIDYVVFTGDSYAGIMGTYARLTGAAPVLPEWAAGFWQSKLRYRNQDELLRVAREYKKRGLPLSVIVIDFFHWTMLGEFQFDKTCWPDPAAMVRELKSMGIELAVSIWPMVNHNSRNYAEMQAKGLLIRAERGVPVQHKFIDTYPEGQVFSQYYDATNPETLRYVWDLVRKNYYEYGIRVFWLDNCEPDIQPADFDNLRLHLGNGSEVACVYPLLNAKGFHDGLKAAGEREIVTLSRSGWAGVQRFGAIIWSGDVYSSFGTLRDQVRAGLNMAMSGVPWWTTDIGGFHGGDPSTPEFRELIIRWFQYGVFCPIFRLHGVRSPSDWSKVPTLTGVDNEVWSFGDQAYAIITELLRLRERLMPYIMAQMRAASEMGIPPMRPIFFDFAHDPQAFTWEDEFLFGPDILVAPVTEAGALSRRVYLPSGTRWRNAWTDEVHSGGEVVEAQAPIERIPVFIRADSAISLRS